jgi:hypothetical protein
MPTPMTRQPGRKAPRPPTDPPASPRVRRRRWMAHTVVKKGATLLQVSPRPREIPGVLKPKAPGARGAAGAHAAARPAC